MTKLGSKSVVVAAAILMAASVTPGLAFLPPKNSLLERAKATTRPGSSTRLFFINGDDRDKLFERMAGGAKMAGNAAREKVLGLVKSLTHGTEVQSFLLSVEEYFMEDRSPMELAMDLTKLVRDNTFILQLLSPDAYKLAPKAIRLVDEKIREGATTYEYDPEGTKEPIFALDDDYAYPTLFKEAHDMLEASMFMYVWAEIRTLAKEAKKNGGNDEATTELIDTALELPLNVETARQLLLDNSEVVGQAIKDENHKQVRRAFAAWALAMDNEDEEDVSAREDAKLLKFKDAKDDDGIVYAIGVFPARKRVTLAFRGTNTQTDVLQDIRVTMRKVDNPLEGHKNLSDKIRYHDGFYTYLRPQLENIKKEIKAVMKDYPGYKLYVTGHSLGAALATMCSFELAASKSEHIPHPISCISMASPYVGDKQFRNSFQFLESQGKLRHLRVHNQADLVTFMPFVGLPMIDPANPSFYKHVGIGLELGRDNHRIHYDNPISTGHRDEGDSFERRLNKAWKNNLLGNVPDTFENTLQNHLGQYDIRLTSNKDKLDPLSLNDLYADPTLVGSLKNLADVLNQPPKKNK